MIRPKPLSFYERQLTRFGKHGAIVFARAEVETAACPYHACKAKPGERCKRKREGPHMSRADAHLQGLYEAWKQERGAA